MKYLYAQLPLLGLVSLLGFLVQPQYLGASCLLSPPLSPKQTQWQDPISKLTWSACPIGQVVKGQSCQGKVQTLDWLNAMRYQNDDLKNNKKADTSKTMRWELPSAAQIQSALATCADQERTAYKTISTIWSRDSLAHQPLQALMVSIANGELITEYKTINAPIFLVQSTVASMPPILFAEEEWIGLRHRVQKALAADNKTALAEAASLETQDKFFHARQIYENLNLRKKPFALTTVQRALVEQRLSNLNQRSESIP